MLALMLCAHAVIAPHVVAQVHSSRQPHTHDVSQVAIQRRGIPVAQLLDKLSVTDTMLRKLKYLQYSEPCWRRPQTGGTQAIAPSGGLDSRQGTNPKLCRMPTKVFSRPSRSCTLGSQSRSRLARLISGWRCLGSSAGSG